MLFDSKNNLCKICDYGPKTVILVLLACVVNRSSSYSVPYRVLHLEEGEICSQDGGPNTKPHVCTQPDSCDLLPQSIRDNKYFDVCTFNRRVPIVCCPPGSEKKTSAKTRISNSAVEKCREYNAMNFTESDSSWLLVVGGIEAKPFEFPHMAILGYGDTTQDKLDWKCGGSLISERWILTAAHCHQRGTIAKWARLGDLNIDSTKDDALPKDYRIIHHVIHPDYKPTERYNDIALFLLKTNVEFSRYVRPACLNTDQSLNPPQLIATGWGRTATAESTSDHLLKVTLNALPTSQCNDTYFSQDSNELKFGILEESMMCVGSSNDNEDTCSGDSGGPLQIRNDETNIKTYTQFGITSFGPGFCGIKEKPAVYTRVSNYISWIEGIVWFNS